MNHSYQRETNELFKNTLTEKKATFCYAGISFNLVLLDWKIII